MKLKTDNFYKCKYNKWDGEFKLSYNSNFIDVTHDWGNNVGDIGTNFLIFPYENYYIIIWGENFGYLPNSYMVTCSDASHYYKFDLNSEFGIPDDKVWFHPQLNKNTYIPTRGTWSGEDELEKFFDNNGYNETLNNQILEEIS